MDNRPIVFSIDCSPSIEISMASCGQTLTQRPHPLQSSLLTARLLTRDIALTKHGPIALEANQGFGIEPQYIFGGWKDKLKIQDPKYYWKNRGKR